MSQRLSEYLAHEAGEYLERMSRLLSASASPNVDEMLRLARGIRGSARMAGAVDVAATAERLEAEVRTLAGGPSGPPDDARERCLRAIAELEVLLYTAADDPTPISELFYDDEGPHVIGEPASGAPAGEVVPVEDLQYGGDAALRHALELRPALRAALAAGDRTASAALLDEVFDLIGLALPADA